MRLSFVPVSTHMWILLVTSVLYSAPSDSRLLTFYMTGCWATWCSACRPIHPPGPLYVVVPGVHWHRRPLNVGPDIWPCCCCCCCWYTLCQSSAVFSGSCNTMNDVRYLNAVDVGIQNIAAGRCSLFSAICRGSMESAKRNAFMRSWRSLCLVAVCTHVYHVLTGRSAPLTQVCSMMAVVLVGSVCL